ncbi:dTDP-4-dehydrorhamnose 3,5-epimerase [Achromatium sp. WMS2]|nr:dTDP-4-dehydrorhamnose 3,5-epimerase [Achromatium sp. WMS2]
MSRFSITDLPIANLKLITRQRIGDTRGFIARLFCTQELAAAGWKHPIVQINHSFTAKCGTVRGLHYQKPPHAEVKLVSCIRGAIWDLAVDLRRNSPTYLHWHAEHLTADNGNALMIPEGFAHGFQTLTDNCELIYLHTAPYTPTAEAGLRYNDPQLAITWPVAISELSARDSTHALITPQFNGVLL